MTPRRPRAALATHDVSNQPPPIGDMDLWADDAALRDGVRRGGGQSHDARLAAFAKQCGSETIQDHARFANENPPKLTPFDRYGHRLDEAEFHPSYHALMALGLEGGVSAGAWTADAAGHVLHAGLLYLMGQAEPSVCCPMSMTYAVVPALRHEPSVAAFWEPLATSARYDPSFRPASEKKGVTLGMAMTEKQGGSDVRANDTRAEASGDAYRLTGHKWFCSAPMSDAFLTLAYLDGGLTCFLVPRWTPDGERNAIQIMRLKDKLGDKANASSEVEYHNAFAIRIGEPGRGVRTIIDMVHHTRLDCVIAPAAFMRRTVREAVHHVRHRRAFQKTLIDQPLMGAAIADLLLECEAATALAFRLAAAFDRGEAGDADAHAFARIATPIAKYWLNKRVVPTVHEAMEAHGGAGYVEESPLPRYFRQAPLNGIWEGSGNVMCLDVLRALAKEPAAGVALWSALDAVSGAHPAFDRHCDDVRAAWDDVMTNGEARARRLVEALGLALQAATLLESDPDGLGAAFCAARLDAGRAFSFGASREPVALEPLLARASS